jgi:hypothetical protein
MTTQRCAHGLPMATWCDDCAADFTVRTGPDPVGWSIRADDEHPERVFAWIAIAALGWLAVGLIVWRIVR